MFPFVLAVTILSARRVKKTLCVFCIGSQRGRRRQRGQVAGLDSRPVVAEWNGWVMTQSLLDNKLYPILLTSDSISAMSLLHSRNVFHSLLFALLDVGNNLIFFCTQSSALLFGQHIAIFPSCMSASFSHFS